MMSADTHMNEMLLVGTKRTAPRGADEPAAVTCVNLSKPLRSLVEAHWCAKLHIGMDAGSGLVRGVEFTPANVADTEVADALAGIHSARKRHRRGATRPVSLLPRRLVIPAKAGTYPLPPSRPNAPALSLPRCAMGAASLP